MAKKIMSFKVDEKKKVIIIYTNVEANAAEKELKEWYLANGYKPMTDIKKQGTTIKEMRKVLEEDPDALTEFNRLYKSTEKVKNEKGKEEVGFHRACKYYIEWKKKNK